MTNPIEFKYFTIQFQLNLSGLKTESLKDAEYQFKIIQSENVDVHYIQPENPKKTQDGYITIPTWDHYINLPTQEPKLDKKINGIFKKSAQKAKEKIKSTKPTIVQFITKLNTENTLEDYQIKFRIYYEAKNKSIDFEPLKYDRKIIPNSTFLLSSNDQKLYVILNSQESFNISYAQVFKGLVIDEKGHLQSNDPKCYDIYFKDQDLEYVLYASEICSEKYRWYPFRFRYLNLENPKLYIRFYYFKGGKVKILNQKNGPTVNNYIDYSYRFNSRRDFFKFKLNRKTVPEYIEPLCIDETTTTPQAPDDNPSDPSYFIFPLIQISPIDIQKAKALKKVSPFADHVFIDEDGKITENNPDDQSDSMSNLFDKFYNSARAFMTNHGIRNSAKCKSDFPSLISKMENSDLEMMNFSKCEPDSTPPTREMMNFSKCEPDSTSPALEIRPTDWSNYKQLTFEKVEENKTRTGFAKNVSYQFEEDMLSTSISFNHKKNSQMTQARMNKKRRRGKNASSSHNIRQNANEPLMKYQTIFIYEYDKEIEKQTWNDNFKSLVKTLDLFPHKVDYKPEIPNEEIFSLSGSKMLNINRGIYDLNKSFSIGENIQKYQDEDKNKNQNKKKKVELYSGFPLIVVTLFRSENTWNASDPDLKTKLSFWTRACNEYPFIKLICVRHNSFKVDDQIIMKYLAEIKCVYDKFVYWTKSINFQYPIQMRIDPKSPLSLSLTDHQIFLKRGDFIRKRLLELLRIDVRGWHRDKCQISIYNYFYWKDIEPLLFLRDEKFIPQKNLEALEYLKWIQDNKKKENSIYATVLAAATAILYHNDLYDPYSDNCFTFALDWIKNVLSDQGHNYYADLEGAILGLNQIQISEMN